ncbi:cytochrome c biogenesis protein CcsA, partial [Bacillus paralicheniformis]
WSYVSLETLYWADPKVLGSIVLLFLYGYYLFIRIVKELQGRIAAMWNTASFLVLLINFFLLGSFSQFHWFS